MSFPKSVSRLIGLNLILGLFICGLTACQTTLPPEEQVCSRPGGCPRAAMDAPMTEGAYPAAAELARVVPGHSKRASSWEENGGNKDFIHVAPGETRVLLDTDGPGMITRFYCTIVEPDVLDFRDTIIRMYWDGEEMPSVEVPLGDFFCVSNCTVRHFSSAMMAVNPGGDDKIGNSGYVCYFPMPFNSHARIELVNESDRFLGGAYQGLWYHIDYENYDQPFPDDIGRFHAQYRQEKPTQPIPFNPDDPAPVLNTTGAENYVILEATGEGHVAGVLLQVNNLEGGWWGEGDEAIFIDGDVWPPSIHGTGSEEMFNGGPTPDVEFTGLYSGFLLVEGAHRTDFGGLNAMYRWYTPDPIRFRKSIRMTIEHGHADIAPNDYASVAYWYQKEPHAPFPALPGIDARRPRFPESFWTAHEKAEKLYKAFSQYRNGALYAGNDVPRHMWRILRWTGELLNDGCGLMHLKDYDGANEVFTKALAIWESREQ